MGAEHDAGAIWCCNPRDAPGTRYYFFFVGSVGKNVDIIIHTARYSGVVVLVI